MNCINCGTEVKEQTNKCEYCGGDSVYTNDPYMQNAKKDKKRHKVLLISIAIMLLVIAVAVVLALSIAKSPEELVAEYCEAYYSGDAGKVVNLWSDDVIKWGIDQGHITSKREFVFQMQESLGYELDDLDDEFGEWQYLDAKIIEEFDFNKTQIKELEKRYDFSIGKVKGVEIEISIVSRGEVKKIYTDVAIIKQGLSWYVLMGD